jgi:hypothetical protein
LGFGADNKNIFPTEPQITQIYLSSNAVTINWRSETYPRRSIAGITPRIGVDDEANVADLKVVKNLTYQHHGASRHDSSAMAPVQQHSAAHGVLRSTPTHTAHHESFRIQSTSVAEEEVFGLENLTA